MTEEEKEKEEEIKEVCIKMSEEGVQYPWLSLLRRQVTNSFIKQEQEGEEKD